MEERLGVNYFPLTKQQQEWQERAADIAARELAPRAEETDQKAQYPQASLDALKREGLFGLRVSKEHGGLGEDMLTTSLIIEELSKKCASTAMCYKMHLEAAEIICRIPTPYQVEHFVEPMAQGEVFTTIAGGESQGEGDNWNATQTASHVDKVAGGYQINNVRKSYVTSAGKATHYQFACRVGADTPQSDRSALFVERDNIEWAHAVQRLRSRREPFGSGAHPAKGHRGLQPSGGDPHLRRCIPGHCLRSSRVGVPGNIPPFPQWQPPAGPAGKPAAYR